MLRIVKEQDLNQWLELAKEVEPLFGEMAGEEEFQKGIKECIAELSAFCFENTTGDVEGIVAVNRVHNEIAWFAVRERSRGKGYGHALLKIALANLDNQKPIFVQTFAPDTEAGQAARKLYMQFGFEDYKKGGKNPAGIDTVIMQLKEKVI